MHSWYHHWQLVCSWWYCMAWSICYAQTGWENSLLSFFPSLGKWLPAECRDYCQLINGWVWFESWTCRGWL